MTEMEEEISRMGFDAAMAKNLAEIVRLSRKAAIEECAQTAENAWPPAHTYAGENASIYRGQDLAVRVVVKAIRDLVGHVQVTEGK